VKRAHGLHGSALRVAAAAVIALAGCAERTEEWSVDLTVPVTVQPVGRGTIEAVVLVTGTLRAVRQATMVTEARGRLLLRPARGGTALVEGARVAAGDTLFDLLNDELVVGARLRSRELAMENARRTLAEQEALLARGLAVELDAETARKALVDAETEYRDALIQLAKLHGVAPIAGFVTGLTTITPGTLAEQGTTVCTLMDYEQVVVDLQIPSAHLRAVTQASPVRVRNYAFPEDVFEGRITAVDPAVDPATRTFMVRATIPNPELRLRPGMFVEAEVVTDRRADVIVVPRALVLLRQNRQVVFVEEAARAEMRLIETGLEDASNVEVVSGLEEGERLITSNHETLRPRTRVQVTNAGPAASGGPPRPR